MGSGDKDCDMILIFKHSEHVWPLESIINSINSFLHFTAFLLMIPAITTLLNCTFVGVSTVAGAAGCRPNQDGDFLRPSSSKLIE